MRPHICTRSFLEGQAGLVLLCSAAQSQKGCDDVNIRALPLYWLIGGSSMVNNLVLVPLAYFASFECLIAPLSEILILFLGHRAGVPTAHCNRHFPVSKPH